MNHRSLRVGELLRDEISIMIERDIEVPGALLTVTTVEVDKKLEHAKVGVSVLPTSKTEEVFRLLRAVQGKFQYLLMKKINIKPLPRIEFVIDRGPEHAADIEKILLKEDNNE